VPTKTVLTKISVGQRPLQMKLFVTFTRTVDDPRRRHFRCVAREAPHPAVTSSPRDTGVELAARVKN
jgi:hypothetical protein